MEKAGFVEQYAIAIIAKPNSIRVARDDSDLAAVAWAVRRTDAQIVVKAEPLKVAIFATAHTVQTGAYVTEIGLRAPQIQVAQKACPELVSMIEGNAPHNVISKAVRRYVRELLETNGIPEVCVLGCTHYPLIEDHFVSELPASVTLLSQAEVTAKSLAAYLQRHPRYSATSAPSREFLTTGDATQVSALATRFYGRSVRFAAVTGAGPPAT